MLTYWKQEGEYPNVFPNRSAEASKFPLNRDVGSTKCGEDEARSSTQILVQQRNKFDEIT
jgi:hypothetical protein